MNITTDVLLTKLMNLPYVGIGARVLLFTGGGGSRKKRRCENKRVLKLIKMKEKQFYNEGEKSNYSKKNKVG